ncbi:MAG TPA: flagellar hook capping FlgD N-terminal domain-containing protein [Syntrophorhabdaceae bacterium]|mgnify:CR=1 FL=1|nr:flagellar hook capping FlgD N-terminal domain-containing protein [Syntrophorhabdaceae bacterium]HPP06326.1 flagellar hook capping FlgD N-terminal domain-containing protein [Syntrophorhabdaceae bacterium]
METTPVTYNTFITGSNQKLVSKDDFLKILVTQLKYQNPLDPQKPEEFLTQLSQMTQVEQLQNITSSLEGINSSMKQSNISQWISTVGKKMLVEDTIMSKGDELYLKPSGDFDEIILTKTNLTTGAKETVSFKKGDPLVYTHEGDDAIGISVSAKKGNQSVACNTLLYRVIAGVNIEQEKPTLVATNGNTYSTEKVKEIK